MPPAHAPARPKHLRQATADRSTVQSSSSPRQVLRTNMTSKASSPRLGLPANVPSIAKPAIRSTTTSRLAASRRLIFLKSFEVIGISKTVVMGRRTWSSTKTLKEIERKTAHETLHCCAVNRQHPQDDSRPGLH